MMTLPDELPKFILAVGDSGGMAEDFVLALQFKQEEWDTLPEDRRKEIRRRFADLWRFIYGCTYEHDPNQETYNLIVGEEKEVA